MGHNQTAKGMLRFEKVKSSSTLPGGLVQVKVSGVLKAEGAIVGNFIKDGRYAVIGEQHYDPKSREWRRRPLVGRRRERLANAAGVTVAHAKGKMVVDSKMLGDAPLAGVQKNSDRVEASKLRITKMIRPKASRASPFTKKARRAGVKHVAKPPHALAAPPFRG